MADKIDSIQAVDESYLLADGTKLRVWIQYPKILENTRKYEDALKQARGIPLNDNELNSMNPMVAWAIKDARERGLQFPTRQEEAEYGVRRAANIYHKYAEDVAAAAVLLAMTGVGDNIEVFRADPIPYDENPEEDVLPGLELEVVPTLTPQITYPVERRFKRLMDVLDTNRDVLGKIMQHVNVIGGLVWGAVLETDPAGFQPDTVDGTVLAKTGSKRKSQG